MPIYPYECVKCGTEFEVLCRFDEREDEAVCPSCGGREVESVVTSFAPIQPKF